MLENDGEQPLVSVVIPTLNSARFLSKCLLSLKQQTWRRLEIIVVDDGSTDDTVKIAQKFGCLVVKGSGRGRAEAKNEGIRQGTGEFFFFVDSDMEIAPDVIRECMELVKQSSRVGGVVVPERSIGDGFWVRVRDFERGLYAGSVVESARFFPAELVRPVGGFEEAIVFFEESTLPCKIQRQFGRDFARTNSVILHHEDGFSLKSWVGKKFLYGKTIRLYRERFGEVAALQAGVSFRLGLFWESRRRLLGTPKLAIGLVVLKGLEFFAVICGEAFSRGR